MIVEQIKLHQSTISLGTDCLAEVLVGLSLERYSSVFVFSQQRIWDFHGAKLMAGLSGLNPAPRLRLIADGEQTKNLVIFGELLSWLAESGADRSSLIVVLGGGVVGDLCGYVAASYMRGIDWVYIPTTLLAQQDASVGGKVAVNLPQGKNLVGVFWEPRAVIIDGLTLETLPTREVNAGYMELLKHGLLHSQELFATVAALPVGNLDFKANMALLAQGLKVKLNIVARDPFEKGERRLLNLGHTLGHAIESYTDYHSFLHGEAVGLGLIYACLLARQLGSSYNFKDLFAAVRLRLPDFAVTEWDSEKILALTTLDKKSVKGVVAWIIPYEPGRVEIVADIEGDQLRAAFQDFVTVMR